MNKFLEFLEIVFHAAWIVSVTIGIGHLSSCEMSKHRQTLLKDCLVAGRTVQDCELIK